MDAPSQRESSLLAKARQLGLAGSEDLEQLAIERGCDYYDLSSRMRETAPSSWHVAEFGNEELAIALLAPPHRNLLRTRMAAAMLGASGNDAATVAQLALDENCADIVDHIATCGQQVEPENAFWTNVKTALGGMPAGTSASLPHLSRFVEMTGINRGKVGTQMRWIRPSKQPVYA